MATIRAMRNKWQAIVRRKGHPALAKTFELRKDAEKWARQQERLIDAGEWVDQAQARQTSLAEMLDRYLNEVTVTKRGKVEETSRIHAFKRSELAKYSASAISSQMIAAWRDVRLRTVKSSTVTKELNLLSHIFSVALRDWGLALPANPVSRVRKPPQPEARNRVLKDSERTTLLVACADCRNPWIHPVVVFALETAARGGEILSLKWVDVELRAKTAKVMGKTGSRSIPLSPLCTALLQSLPRSVDGRVFPVSIEALKQAYARAVTRCGIKNFTFHDLRHDALTRLAKQGLSVLELRAISGHTTANMLQRYVAIDASDLAAKLATGGPPEFAACLTLAKRGGETSLAG